MQNARESDRSSPQRLANTSVAPADALATRLTAFLGEPASQTKRLLAWRKGAFEVGLHRHNARLWISPEWKPDPALLEALTYTRYAPSKSRASSLKTHLPTLAPGHEAWHIWCEAKDIDAIVRLARACAEKAGVPTTTSQPSSTAHGH